MTDRSVPQTLAPNALITSELKPSVFMRWIDLAMDLGPLDYKEYRWEELEERWGIIKKPVQKMVRTLEAAGWLSSEKTRDGVRIYLFPTADAAESHLKRIKAQTEDAWKVNTGKRPKTARDKQPYRNQYMVEKGNFTQVPETILQDQRFTNMQLGVYVVIRCTTNTHSFWGERKLAEKAGMALSTFTEHLKTLKEAGYIVYDGVERLSNRYEFNDMPESLSVQVESPSVQSEPVSVQMESLSVPINTKHNTELGILTTTTDPTGVAGGQNDNQREPGISPTKSDTASDSKVIPGVEETEEVDMVLPLASEANGSAVISPSLPSGNQDQDPWSTPRSVEELMELEKQDQVHRSDDPSALCGNRLPRPRSTSTYLQDRAALDDLKRDRKHEKLKAQEARMEARRAEQKANKARILGEPQKAPEAAMEAPAAMDPVKRLREYLSRQQAATVQP
ncbi:hypothetical protein ABZX85_09725 [Streptomyces sp. NPDC004539]|uniref:hypothetical protein n=1 Tax=Streptomyces sp. NPDC004539 TaxID=3154280 RepID=UPI0033B93246